MNHRHSLPALLPAAALALALLAGCAAGPSAAGQAHLSRGLGGAAGGDARTHGVNGMAAGRQRRL